MSRKKVVVRRFGAGFSAGYAPAVGMVLPGPPVCLDLMDLSGRAQALPMGDVKYVSFVRDFNSGDAGQPEGQSRKTFLARPRTEGLWLRIRFRDGDEMEGLAPIDIALAEGWAVEGGVYLLPPDVRGNTQRLFVPRSAMEAMEVLAVVTTPTKKKVTAARAAEAQADLFAVEIPAGGRLH